MWTRWQPLTAQLLDGLEALADQKGISSCHSIVQVGDGLPLQACCFAKGWIPCGSTCCTTAAGGMDYGVPTKVKGRRVLVRPVVHRASQGGANGVVFVSVLRVPPDQRTSRTYNCLYPTWQCHANLYSPEVVAGHLPERTDAACGGESRQRRPQQQGKLGLRYAWLLVSPAAMAARECCTQA